MHRAEHIRTRVLIFTISFSIFPAFVYASVEKLFIGCVTVCHAIHIYWYLKKTGQPDSCVRYVNLMLWTHTFTFEFVHIYSFVFPALVAFNPNRFVQFIIFFKTENIFSINYSLFHKLLFPRLVSSLSRLWFTWFSHNLFLLFFYSNFFPRFFDFIFVFTTFFSGSKCQAIIGYNGICEMVMTSNYVTRKNTHMHIK